MANSRGASGGSRGGRAKGTPNRDKTELRAMTQEAVLDFTTLKRQEIKAKWSAGYRPNYSDGRIIWQKPDNPELGEQIPPDILDGLQPIIEEYDPVVELSVIAADYSNKIEIRRQANADAAQYLRPKLKSIELLEDPESLEIQDEKNRMASKMVKILEAMQEAKRDQS